MQLQLTMVEDITIIWGAGEQFLKQKEQFSNGYFHRRNCHRHTSTKS